MGYFSNGTEGMMYEEQYCCNCIHLKEDGCPVLHLHMLWNYEQHKDKTKKIALEALIPQVMHKFSDGIEHKINGECLMFVERNA